ncbi:mitochondrial outer membrane translocase complex, subunit Tom22, partial [Thamnocephalis sphaerospora]
VTSDEEDDDEEEEAAARARNAEADDVDDLEEDWSDDDLEDETFLERVAALKEIVPLETRDFMSRQADRFISTVWQIKSMAGSLAWVISTSALMIGVPLVFEIERENMFVQYEKEMNLQQQSMQPMAPGAP